MAWSAAISIFLGAFLLFLVQPILGKMILPWFGGTPAVWTTCMLFFQLLLLAGYAYAAQLTRRLKPFGQASLHAVVLMIAVCLLPINPSGQWKPVDGQQPVIRILGMLLACVGAQYFLLSATSPLVQSWFTHAFPTRSPYRLYALSNVGSLGALLIYPFVVEPAIGTTLQGWIWSGGFVIYVIFCAAMAWQLRGTQQLETPSTPMSAEATQPAAAVTWVDRLTWLCLPALASMLLLAVTNHLCQDVAVVPFFWIVPLSLYLVSLIICFDRDRWYSPFWMSVATMIVILVACDMAFIFYTIQASDKPLSNFVFFLRYDIRATVTVFLSVFFLACMLCHGEVVRRRPAAGRLTDFYLTISAGGALGGFFVAVVCPNVFQTFIELKIGVVLTFILAVWVCWRQLGLLERTPPAASEPSAASKRQSKKNAPAAPAERAPTAALPNVYQSLRISPMLRKLLLVFGVVLIGVVIAAQSLVTESSSTAGPRSHYRNFYGTLIVRNWYGEEDDWHGRALYHGSILHGYQFLKPGKQLTPTTYYSEDSGVGLTLRAKRQENPIKVGAVGLGIGTVAAYAEPGDTYRFYEINPLIIELARSSFDFLPKCPGNVEIAPGDARLSLEREEPQGFDVLILDAFSGDAIPVHLLTREAIELYLRHLKPDGALAIHISNRHVDLQPVVNYLAQEFGLHMASVDQPAGEGLHLSASEWRILSRDASSLSTLAPYVSLPTTANQQAKWTDDFNNLYRLLR